MQLFLSQNPRKLILATDAFALSFSPPPQTTPFSSSPDVVVEFVPRSELALDNAVSLHSRVAGCLGVLRVGEDTFLPIITSALVIASHSSLNGPGAEPISRILSVEFFCLTSSKFDSITSPGAATDSYGNSGDDFDLVSSSNPNNPLDILEHPCAGIRKILSSGSFYFAGDAGAGVGGTFDITTRLEARLARQTVASAGEDDDDADGDADTDSNVEEADPRFLWNSYMIAPLVAFRQSLPKALRKILDHEAFVVRAIQGFCGLYDISIGGQTVVLSLVSRLGWKRAGTRFNVRGVDDDGSTANFVETETILRTSSMIISYVQVRGSVPLFWEEVGLQPFGLKITITRPLEASLPAFTRHFESLLDTYEHVHIVNLLSTKDQEAQLTDAYAAHLDKAGLKGEVGMTAFDFHARSKIGGIESVKSQLKNVVGSVGQGFGACIAAVDGRGEESTTLIMPQQGVFRTNCKDCLDRTNVVQDVLSQFAIVDFMRNTNPTFQGSDAALWSSHRVLWAENGDALSKIYVGTGAINTSFTRSGKKSFAGLLSDATKSVGRMYQSNFIDGGKQKSIDALLGHLSTSQKVRVYNPVNDALREGLKARATEYTSYEDTTIWVGTYNLNGKGPSSESLIPWLFPASSVSEPSFLVISFQEIVPLTPQMIMATDPEKKRRWEAHILQHIDRRPGKKSDYIILRSGQLVGTALIVLIKKELANDVRNVEAATKKTGLKGMAGNKGAVAIRLDYRDTSFCFVTAHLAAGHSNVDERNSDYFTIADGLRFSRGRTIPHHDNVVWAADTNYRISLPNEEVRQLAEVDDYAQLYQGDQLAQSMARTKVFAGYYEAPLLFRPTYKYEPILPSSSEELIDPLDVSNYHRAELFASDHRPGAQGRLHKSVTYTHRCRISPVFATFRARIRKVDHQKKSALRKVLLQEIVASEPGDKNEEKLLRIRKGFADAAASQLPPPSDEQQAWWNVPDHPDGTVTRDALQEASLARSSDPFSSSKPPTIPKRVPPPSISTATSNSTPSSAPPIPPSRNSEGAVSRRKPAPPRPIPVPKEITPLSTQPGTLSAKIKPIPPPIPARATKSPLEDQEDSDFEHSELSSKQRTGEAWQVIEAS
ncbi:synaptojanin, partial [Phenoliferia sp. Uapishka_3]